MTICAACDDALYLIELGETADDDLLVVREPGGTLRPRARPVELAPGWVSSLLVDVAVAGSTIVLVVDRRPPLLISHDLGATWSERGGGLPRGKAVAIGSSPDEIGYAARNRLYVSIDGGRFWRAVGIELPEIVDLAWD
jgi:hypothetical protein